MHELWRVQMQKRSLTRQSVQRRQFLFFVENLYQLNFASGMFKRFQRLTRIWLDLNG